VNFDLFRGIHIQEADLVKVRGVEKVKCHRASTTAVIGRVIWTVFINDQNITARFTVRVRVVGPTRVVSTTVSRPTISSGPTTLIVGCSEVGVPADALLVARAAIHDTVAVVASAGPFSPRHGGIENSAPIIGTRVIATDSQAKTGFLYNR
jgi:hypothetical protein